MKRKSNRVKLSESKLRNIVRKSVRKIMNEGSSDQQLYNQWLNIQENIGAEAFLDNIWNWLSSDELSNIIEYAIHDGYLTDPYEDEDVF